MRRVLLCGAGGHPHSVIGAQHAVSRLACQDGLKVLAAHPSRQVRSQRLTLALPLIVMDAALPPAAWEALGAADTARVTRRVLFARDGYQCQYCGLQARPGQAGRLLTVDHVKPACRFPSRAAATTWENVTAACLACNQAKADRLPWECGMWPGCFDGRPRTPKRPTHVQLRFAGRLGAEQRSYVLDFHGLQESSHAL